MRKLKTLLAFCALLLGVGNVSAETDYTSLMPNDWTSSTGNTGNFQGGKERYNGDQNNFTAGAKVLFQSFTAPAAGIYEIKFYAVASCTAERYKTETPYYGPNIAQAYATAGTNKATVAMTVINQTGCTLVADANIRTLSVEAAEGETIEYGIENIATGGNWYTVKALSAKMKTVAEIFQSQYDEAYAIWEHSTENEEGAKATFKTYVDAMNTALTGTLAEAQTASDNLAAALVTYESKSYPVKGSGVKYDFTSKMNMAINAWTCPQGNGPAQYGFTGATETYGNTTAGEVMYQTISGLANGEYEIHFYAVANAANGGGTAGSELTYVYANDKILNIDVITQSSCTPSDYERTFTVMVKDGTLKYGITNNAAAGNWNICKNVALYMTGAPDLSDYYDAIAGKLTTANGLKTSPMKSTVLSALQDAIDATSGYTDITVIGTLETMSNNLTTAINNANTSISNYADALSVLNAASSLDEAGQAYYAANETVAGIKNEYDAGTLDAVTDEQKAACAAVLPLAARVQTSVDADWTAVLVNPSFETNDFTGWTNSGSMAVQGNTSFTLKDGSYYAEFWQPNGTKSVTQTINDIPVGVYSISAKALARGVTSAKLFAAGEEEAVTVKEDPDTYTVEFFQSEDGSVTFGFEGVGTGASSSWICVDNFTMKFVRSATAADYKELLSSTISAATSARKVANEGDGVFQIPASAGTTLASAIEAAQSVYDNEEATISDIKTAVSTLNAAVETYEATTLNAPEANTYFNLIVATEGHSMKGNPVTLVTGNTTDNNPTGYGMNAKTDNTSYLSQAVTFTQVKDNIYNISFETAVGTVYMTYGTLNGSAAGWKDSQIQATTDANNKGEFRIAATATANVFNIYNTITNSTIACQTTEGNSIYTEPGNADFTIKAQTFADVAISSAGLATFASDYALDFTGSNVKAYRATISGSTITFKRENKVPAGEGVLLKAEEGEYKIPVATGVADWEDADNAFVRGTNANVLSEEDGYRNYVLANAQQGVGFYLANGLGVADSKAYLQTTETTGARLSFVFSDETTGINAVQGAAQTVDGEVYNLNGQRVATPKRGLYIQNGKKIIMK